LIDGDNVCCCEIAFVLKYFPLQIVHKPMLRDFEPFQVQCDHKHDFPNPACISEEHPEMRWLDAVKLRHNLVNDVIVHRNKFCALATDELRELKRQSMLPHLSRGDLIKELQAPCFDLLPVFKDELQMLASNLKTRSQLVQEHLQSKSNEVVPSMGEGGNFFSSVGDGIDVTEQLKHSWKSKLATKVEYNVQNSERERNFHDRMIAALEKLHNQSLLDHLDTELWPVHWSTRAFVHCKDVTARDLGMIQDITVQVFASNSLICGRHLSKVADKAARDAVSKSAAATTSGEARAAATKTAIDAKWNRMLRDMLPEPCPPPLRLINVHMLSHLDVIKVECILRALPLFFDIELYSGFDRLPSQRWLCESATGFWR